MWRWIMARLPEDAPVYAEPFAGALSVLLNRPRAGREIANDADPFVVNWWRTVRDRPGDLMGALRSLPQTYEGWDRARNAVKAGFAGGGVEVAALWCCAITDSFGSMMRSYQPRKCGAGSADMIDRIPALANRMSGVEITEGDAVGVIASLDDPAALIYADPPYPSAFEPLYTAAVDQEALDAALLASRCRVAVSGYASERPALAGWRRFETPAQVTLNSTSRWQRSVECLWANYDPPGQLEMF